MIDIRQTPQYAKYLKTLGWQVERVSEINYFLKKIPIFGMVMKVQRPEEIRNKKIVELSSKYKLKRIIVEPKRKTDEKFLVFLNYKKTNPYLPSKTLILDLTKTKETLVKKAKKDARQAFKKTKSFSIEEIDERDINGFRKSWRKAVSFNRHVPKTHQLLSLKKAFGKNALFLLKEDTGAIFLTTGSIAYYWQAFTGKKGRREMVQYAVLWKGIFWAKARGNKLFDFEGIYDPRFPNKKWKGFSHFKKSFGGEILNYPLPLAKKP